MRFFRSATIILALTSQPAIAEQYLCVAEKASGFRFDETTATWVAATFRADEKFLIAPSAMKGGAWEVKKLGSSVRSYYCEDDFKGDFLWCDTDILLVKFRDQAFRFNKGNGRFMRIYPEGYVNPTPGKPESDNTPSIEIGKCSGF